MRNFDLCQKNVRKKLPNNNSIAEQRDQYLVFIVGIQLKARQTSMGNTSVWIPTLIRDWIQWLKKPLPTLLS